ncbi:MAG TPA: hypothetical protein VMA37_09065 [Acetobacteraceae bacterium]|nr:hypothetical protein [Acetobacteraceae bacterium]
MSWPGGSGEIRTENRRCMTLATHWLAPAGHLQDLRAVDPGNRKQDRGKNDRVNDVSMESQQLCEECADADNPKQHGTECRHPRRDQQTGTNDFADRREVAEPLAEPDRVEFRDRGREACQLGAAFPEEGEGEQNFQHPKGN